MLEDFTHTYKVGRMSPLEEMVLKTIGKKIGNENNQVDKIMPFRSSVSKGTNGMMNGMTNGMTNTPKLIRRKGITNKGQMNNKWNIEINSPLSNGVKNDQSSKILRSR
jgi:hypothetical protein